MAFLNDVSREELDGYVLAQKHASFLQSWDWGEFQERAGCRALRCGLRDGSRLSWAGSAFLKTVFGFKYLYLPRIGIKSLPLPERQDLFRGLTGLARVHECAFLRFEPRSELGEESAGFKIVPTLPVQPKETLYLDLARTEEDILGGFHPKTRYNIRLSEKKGIQVLVANDGDFERFWRIMKETEKRDGFRLHERGYYEGMLAVPWIKLFLAERDGRALAGNIVSFCPGDTAVYIHGASANEGRNLMAPYALQWAAIKTAKALGREYYDFHGIDEGKWPGVTRFKLGFGGERAVYPGAFDLVVDGRRYSMYRILRKIRRLF